MNGIDGWCQTGSVRNNLVTHWLLLLLNWSIYIVLISNIIQLYWMNAKVSLASKRKDYAKVCWKIESYEKFAGKSGTKNSGGEKFVVFFTLLEHAMIYQTSHQENIFDLFDSV